MTFKSLLTILLVLVVTRPGICQEPLIGLKVDYMERPMGIDVTVPYFSWRMKAVEGERGLRQKAYQLTVLDESEGLVWDSEKIKGNAALGIPYAGKPLQPRTRYTWTAKVWDQNGKLHTATSWFETGLLDTDPNSARWNGAQWIGGAHSDLIFYSHYLSVFKMDYSLQLDARSNSTKASFVFGGNDVRLMDKNLNIQGVRNDTNGSHIRFELDISRVDGSDDGLAKFNVYRIGYAKDDSDTVPLRTYDIPLALLNEDNKYAPHRFFVECNFGLAKVYLDGQGVEHKIYQDDVASESPFAPKGFNLNPVGVGNDYISFPMVADVGFYAGAGQKAQFSDLHIRNFREPSNVLFSEELNAEGRYQGIFKEAGNDNFSISGGNYEVNGGRDGTLVLADPSRNAAPMLRTEFGLADKKIAKARLYATARGIYELYLNGKRIGDRYFAPGLTQYNKTHMYQTYDVTDLLLEQGQNAWGAWLGEGWWSGNITYRGENWNYFGDRQSLLGQLIITYTDGSEQVVTTNTDDWHLFMDGPIRYGSFFQGEVYDASKESHVEGWTTTAYDDVHWKRPLEVPLQGTAFLGDELPYEDLQLMGQIGKNPAVVMELTPNKVQEVRPGVFVYDMGQNMVGFPEIQLPPGKAGDTVILRYAEVTYPDLAEHRAQVGMVMLENIRAALTQDMYIRKGGPETIRPKFTFHGYRFLEITGVKEPIALEDIKGKVVSSVDQLASLYETSNELVNKLWENITWSLRGNFLSIPTDTPARNERMGWSGDINVFSKASTYLAHVEPFLRRHLLAMRDIQRGDGRFTDVAPVGGGFGGTLWGSAGIVLPWELYQQYGDVKVLEEHYGAMKDYVEFLNSKIDPETGILHEGPLGDWLSPEAYKNEDTMLWAAYHLYDLDILVQVSKILGKEADREKYATQYKERKAFFNATYLDPSTGKTLHLGNQAMRFGPPLPEGKRKKKGDFVDTQASYAIPLHLNVLETDKRAKVVENLERSILRENEDELGMVRPEYSLMTGFIGTASLNHALSENGKHGLAYRLLQQTSYPSWLYPVINGATTIWERLNSYTVANGFGGNNSMNSFNHYSFGAVAAWMYNWSLGIQRDLDNPGFQHFILHPVPDPTGKMTWAKGHYDSMFGRIESAWERNMDGWVYKTSIPPNSTATLYLEADSEKAVTEGGTRLGKAKGIQMLPRQGKHLVVKLAPGAYVFEIKN